MVDEKWKLLINSQVGVDDKTYKELHTIEIHLTEFFQLRPSSGCITGEDKSKRCGI